MDLYTTFFAAFLVANGAAGYTQYRLSKPAAQSINRGGDEVELDHLDAEEARKSESTTLAPTTDAHTVRAFKLNYLTVYSLVMGADWMQGPYQYALYKDERHLAEHTVGSLFAVGFLTAAASAPLVGRWADAHGRRQMCLAFCVLYALSCLTKLSSSLPVLFLGRTLGGVSTTLLYSVFDAWMVHEHGARGLEDMGLPLSQIFGQMTTCSSLSAIAAGVTGQALADFFGTNVAPFLGSACLLGVAFLLILRHWPENYGTPSSEQKVSSDGIGGGSGFLTIIKDRRMVALALIICFFEGTMYLFVFFWAPALKAARALVYGGSSPPPFGLIFSIFMSAMMLGSQVYTIGGARRRMTVAGVVSALSVVLLVASMVFAVATLDMGASELVSLGVFCVFEASVGFYWPSIGYLRGELVHGGIRGQVYGLLRLPVNIFVFCALILTQDGEQHRSNVFMTCSALLIAASFITVKYLN